MLHALFPQRIHAVTQTDFVIEVLTFVLAHNLKLLSATDIPHGQVAIFVGFSSTAQSGSMSR
jgi:hypothetical protein